MIDREKIINAIEKAKKQSEEYAQDCIIVPLKEADMILSLLKEQEAETGKWLPQPSNKEQGERDFIWWKCSECGQVIYSETERDRKEFHRFCGRCGSRND